jgi:hypothetical protein
VNPELKGFKSSHRKFENFNVFFAGTLQDCDSDSICDEDFKRVLLKSSYCKKFLDPGQYSFADVPRLKLQVLSTTQPPWHHRFKKSIFFCPPSHLP